ncbi:hypothetical protein LINPERPRIM_LOCUS31676, partial [Linum perenne]
EVVPGYPAGSQNTLPYIGKSLTYPLRSTMKDARLPVGRPQTIIATHLRDGTRLYPCTSLMSFIFVYTLCT